MRQKYVYAAAIVLALVAGAWFFTSSINKEPGQQNDLNESRPMAVDNEPSIPMKEEKNIIDIASSDPQFSTLVTAVKAAGLVETLSGEGPFTVFVPTNEAFSKLPEETLEAVLADKEQLTAILTYHVISGKVMAADVVNISSAKTVQGGVLKVEVTGNSVMINNARVLSTDIEASNGVIHVIDTVLIPQ